MTSREVLDSLTRFEFTKNVNTISIYLVFYVYVSLYFYQSV